jgi:hypothetical protein
VRLDDELARRTRFNVFYGSLTPADAQFLRWLLLIPREYASEGGCWSVQTAAAATGTDYNYARAVVQRLVALSLLHHESGGFSIDDEHRPFLSELVAAHEQRTVAERLSEWTRRPSRGYRPDFAGDDPRSPRFVPRVTPPSPGA